MARTGKKPRKEVPVEDYERKLLEDAQRIVEYGQEHEYLSNAFFHVFGQRLMTEGYVDGSYILEAYGRGTYYSQLKNSILQPLFAKACVPSENTDKMIDYLENIIGDSARLNQLEKQALVFWIFLPYLALSKREKRELYLLRILERFMKQWAADADEAYGLDEWEFVTAESVIFDRDLCDVEIVTSVEQYASDTFRLKEKHPDKVLFYRGHSRIDYLLLPGIKREKSWLQKENIMYQELLVRCAQNFTHCQTHLDYLVEMQHYGLPTRLLDITENPLVALYFACCSNKDKMGEVILLCTEAENVKYAKSDTAAVLAALPTLSCEENRKLFRLCKNSLAEENDEEYQKIAGKLAAEIKSRNPAFEPRIKKEDLLGQVFVTPIRNNQRIMKQEGSFVVCGLSGKYGESSSLDNLRCMDEEGKKIVLVVKNKEKIAQELDTLSINRASLFPEIDDVAEYIKEKYR